MKSKHLSTLIALLLVVSLASCMSKLVDPSDGKAALNDQQIKDYLNANQLQSKVTATNSGLYYILNPAQVSPTAKGAKQGEELEFNYVLSYINSNGQAVVVDSANKTKPAYIPFLPGVVIAGLQEGLELLKEGQSGQFYIPSNIGFGGDDRGGKMPAYSPVIFDVTLKRSRTEIEQMDDYQLLKKLSPPDTITAVHKVRVYKLSKGTGKRVITGQTVTVAYTANSLRGTTPFDKSDSLTFNSGSDQYIAGFREGISYLNVGDKALLVFQSSAGYGTQGSYDQSKGYYIVPPYTPLAFEITVKSAK